MPNIPDMTELLGLGAVFTVLFVTLGPLKMLGPIAQLAHDIDESMLRKVAFNAFAIALVAVVIGGFAGQVLLQNWNVPIADMELAGGIIFLLVGLRVVLEQYQPAHAAAAPLPPSPLGAAMRIAFPLIVTPYGIAALIVLLANSHDASRTTSILLILVGVMILNLLALLFVRRIMAGVTLIALQILGAVLGVLQVALAVEMILRGLQRLGVLRV